MDNDSILATIKSLLGIVEKYTPFDASIAMHINSVFLTLHEIGVGPDEGFAITGSTEEWSDYISDNPLLLNAVKTYVYLKVRLLFDPPTGALSDLAKEEIKELEWRINIYADPGETDSQ